LIYQSLTQYNSQIQNKLLPELIFYLLENNTRTRNYATEALQHVSNLAIIEKQLPNLINTLCAGLALDPHFANASLSALTKLSKDLHNLSPEYLYTFGQTILQFLKGERGTSSVYAALEILKVTISLLPEESMLKALQILSEEVKSWEIKKKQKFMMPIAQILQKQDGDMLLKMFGYWNTVVKQVQTMKTKKSSKKGKSQVRKKRKKNKREFIHLRGNSSTTKTES